MTFFFYSKFLIISVNSFLSFFFLNSEVFPCLFIIICIFLACLETDYIFIYFVGMSSLVF